MSDEHEPLTDVELRALERHCARRAAPLGADADKVQRLVAEVRMLRGSALAAEILARLYESEINFKLEASAGVGVDWEIGHGRRDHDEFTEAIDQAERVEQAARDMADAARRSYPKNPFAKWWKAVR
jgi:hypothetical protein